MLLTVFPPPFSDSFSSPFTQIQVPSSVMFMAWSFCVVNGYLQVSHYSPFFSRANFTSFSLSCSLNCFLLLHMLPELRLSYHSTLFAPELIIYY